MHKIYIASSLENWSRVRGLWDTLKQYDIFPTYDWTAHGKSIFEDGNTIIEGKIKSQGDLGKIGWDELVGVLEAEYLLVVLPGERGTHVELGAAYVHFANKQQSSLYNEDKRLLNIDGDLPITMLMGSDTAKRPTSFHYMKGIKRTECEDEAIQHILTHLSIGG
jgi:hypothetical protein